MAFLIHDMACRREFLRLLHLSYAGWSLASELQMHQPEMSLLHGFKTADLQHLTDHGCLSRPTQLAMHEGYTLEKLRNTPARCDWTLSFSKKICNQSTVVVITVAGFKIGVVLQRELKIIKIFSLAYYLSLKGVATCRSPLQHI